MLHQRGNFGSIILAVIIKTSLLASFSITLLTDSAIPIVKPVDVLAEVDDSVGTATSQLYSSDDKSDNNENGGTATSQLYSSDDKSDNNENGGTATSQLYSSDDKSDNNENGGTAAAESTRDNNNKKKRTGWSDIEYLSDANNNTMVDYKNLFGLNIGKVYNPNFVDNADWFLNSSNYEDHVDYYLVPYNYNWHFNSKISAPWYGCEAQSKAMLVTAKKYNVTGDFRYLEFSKKVFNGLNSPVLNQDGWLLGVVTEKHNAKILNSQLFCVANLMTYYEYTGDERGITLFKKGVGVVEKNINDLSEDCGTYYSLSKDRFVSHQKHPEYIKMLERLYLMTESNKLKNTLDKWQHDYKFPCYSEKFE